MEQEKEIETKEVEKEEVETKVDADDKEKKTETPKVLTFDEMLESNKEYQAEYDRRLRNSNATSRTNLAKRLFGREDADIEKEVKSMREKEQSKEQVIAILGKGITDKDEIEFIQFKVSKMEGDFTENLDKYLTENPKFNPTPKIMKKVSSSPSLEGNKMTGEKETNQIMNDVIRSIRG